MSLACVEKPGVRFIGPVDDLGFFLRSTSGLDIAGDPSNPIEINVTGAVDYDKCQQRQKGE